MTQKSDTYSVKKSDAEWKKELDPLQHHVLRDHGTERPFTFSPTGPSPPASAIA